LQDALDMGLSAAVAAQTAVSPDDWTLVASRWQQAIALLQQIPESSPDRDAAEQKISEYQANLAIAQERAQQPIPAGRLPLSSTGSDETDEEGADSQAASSSRASINALCESAQPTQQSQPLEITLPQFRSDEFSPNESYIVGCLTNHGDRPIRSVSISYSYSDGQNAGTNASPLNVVGELIQPGQTLPFRTAVTFESDIPEIEITTIQWCDDGETNCPPSGNNQEISVSTLVRR
jgi:hypothetical protein